MYSIFVAKLLAIRIYRNSVHCLPKEQRLLEYHPQCQSIK